MSTSPPTKTKRKGSRNPPGSNAGGQPPTKEIKWEALEALLNMQGTAEECGAVLGVSADTLDRRVREKYGVTFAEYSREKRAAGRMSLRRAQWVTATQNKNPAMQIWLGKNMLGQTDKQEISGPGGAPVAVAVAGPDYSKLSLDELDQMKALLAKAARKA